MSENPFIVIENNDGVYITSKFGNLDDAKEYFESLDVTYLTDASLLVLLKEIKTVWVDEDG